MADTDRVAAAMSEEMLQSLAAKEISEAIPQVLGQGLALAGRFVDALEQIADSYARSVEASIERTKTLDAAMANMMNLLKRQLGSGG